MLHITNGDAAAGVLREAGIVGEILPWRDVLHDGPVPAGLSLPELSAVRARHIAGNGWGDADEVAGAFAERDETLWRFPHYDEVVLWFEHDLYDQLQLLQLLDFFAARGPGGLRVSLLCGEEYLGNSTPQRLAERFPQRQPVSRAQLELGARGWEAFRSPGPMRLVELVGEGTPALPWVAPALRRHLEQYPSLREGLSRTELQALRAIHSGAATLAQAFHAVREDPIWLGDWSFAGYLRDLATGDVPLLRIPGMETADGPGALMSRAVSLTAAGRDVLEGRADRVHLNGIDRWLGGVHLHGHEVEWRWDPEAGTLRAG